MDVDIDRIESLAEDGYIRKVKNGRMALYNYAPKTQYEGFWCRETMMCRGLILGDDGEVIALPFGKFFNWGEGGRTSDCALREITEKLDGSLGILYRKDGYHIATRGAFDSDQAKWATHALGRFDLRHLPEELTLLFEIIYPDNRVVVDYGPREDLVLIGVRNRLTGWDGFYPDLVGLAEEYGFSVPGLTELSGVEATIEAAKTLELSEEGWVLRFSDGTRFKVKGDAYREVHRFLNHASFRHVLEAVRDGCWKDYVEYIPDEFLDEVRRWEREIQQRVCEVESRVGVAFDAAPKDTRKAFALWVREQHPQEAAYLFAKLDSKKIRPLIYKLAFPKDC